jgi:hypothetical protein
LDYNTWKCHEETPCIAILNNQKCHFKKFYKIREQEGRRGSVWGVDTSGRREDGGKGLEGKDGRNIIAHV